MNCRLARILAGLCGLCVLFSATAAEQLGMVTGNKTGTQIQFGQDIANIASTVGLDILVKESQGSIDNVRRMDSQENAAFGIVNADVLNFLSHSDNPRMRQLADRLRLIFPLYDAEVHLLAGKSIKTFNDLEGKKIIAGEQGGGSWLTTMNLLQITGVKPAQLLNMPHLEAVSAVLKGEADAMLYVSGKPISLFTKVGDLLKKPEFTAMLGNVHFVPLTDARMLREYRPTQLSKADYEWISEPVATLAVKTVLMSFDFSSRQNSYFSLRCQQLAQLGQVIRANLDRLRQNGHPKWKEVNLDEAVDNWKPDRCSRERASNSGNPPSDTGRELEKLLLKR